MDPMNLLKSIWRAEDSVVADILKLRPGQVITGKIIRFYPNQMAEIQIGTHKLMAKIEASLSVNQQYWFQVQSGEGKLRLKVLRNKPGGIQPADSRADQEHSHNLNNSLDGSVEQILEQIPIQLGSNTTDLTIQWNGKKQENGQIDSNDCRILFFLELKNIGELFVDLQIQNRKLSITMFNKNIGHNMIAENDIAILKENLEGLNYHLSSIKFEYPAGVKPLKSLLKKSGPQHDKSISSAGVDLRI